MTEMGEGFESSGNEGKDDTPLPEPKREWGVWPLRVSISREIVHDRSGVWCGKNEEEEYVVD